MLSHEELMLADNYYQLMFNDNLYGFENKESARGFLFSLAENNKELIRTFEKYDSIYLNSDITCYTDASLVVNDKEFLAGGSFVIFQDDNCLVEESFKIDVDKYKSKVSSHLLEYEALLKAIQYIKKYHDLPECLNVTFYTDSDSMANQIKSIHRNRSRSIKKIKEECLEELQVFNAWNVIYIPREENILAHNLAKKATNGDDNY